MPLKTIFLPTSKQSYVFDYVFDDTITQPTIYETAIDPMVATFMSGFNVTVLAYGQTSSGKTYTIGTSGVEDSDSEGIIPRAVRSIFEKCNQLVSSEEEVELELKVSYLELYNEDLFDLLNGGVGAGKSNVAIREDKKGRIIWSGAKEVIVASSQDVWNLLQEGSTRRSVASTKMNQNSSRSHAIFSINLIQTKTKNQMKTQLRSKFHFVDLAGSESLKKTDASGDRAKEGININSGLSALGNVISALADPELTHIPYRNSKLTRLLQDSIGGNSYTVMIACVSPNLADIYESQSTLSYAHRARNIKIKAKKNQEDFRTTIKKFQRC
ncbi:kinesin-domain-containing protein [Neoconidiobolus thromboides FSU 785]|nr:kinesin-domain-containing protein [Neoconidiobolus thromboides FSU 785]